MDIESFVAQSLVGLQAQTQAHSATWHLGEEEAWSVDLDQGLIRFAFSDGVLAETPVQVVGTYSPEDGTFLWAWDHPSVGEARRKHAALAYEFGVEHQLAEYTSGRVICTEKEAWAFTAVTARLANANGAYRGRTGGPWVYLTFGGIKLSRCSTE